MIISFIVLGVLFYFIGSYIEKYKWVKSCKTTKVMEVDGTLYRVYRLEVKEDKDE